MGLSNQAACPLIEVDSDGYVGELIPLWIHSGVNVTSPLEVAAGNDLPAFQNKYGRQIAYRQGVDKRAMARGGENLWSARWSVLSPQWAKEGTFQAVITGFPRTSPGRIFWITAGNWPG